MSDSRQLLFSWPFLKATMRLHDTWKNLPRAKVLETLKVHLERFENADGDEIEKGFDAYEKDTHDQVTAVSYRRRKHSNDWEDWKDTKGLFQEPTNEDFCLKVRLKIRDVDAEAFEISDILPPWAKDFGLSDSADPTDTSD
ncbi:hypothetical protein N7528_002261 [Penicillium herquei]|nr:hypothetical protein N7528_002261 [Penicillium herquei]